MSEQFNREKYAAWLASRGETLSHVIEHGVSLLEMKGVEAIYSLVNEGEQIATKALLMNSLTGEPDVALELSQYGIFVYVDAVMKAYEAAHGPVDWLAAMERRHNRAVEEIERERQAGKTKPSGRRNYEKPSRN